MKARVLKSFRDRYYKKLHKVDDVIEVTEERIEEINSTSHGILVMEIPAEPEDGEIDSIALEKMNKDSIIKYAKEVKNIELDMKMKKEEMIELLSK